MNDNYSFENDPQQSVWDNVSSRPVEKANPIALDIDDEQLAKNLKSRRSSDNDFYKGKYNLKARREANEATLFGRHVVAQDKHGDFKEYQSHANDNVLFEVEESLVPLAMSHLPDIMVLPGSDDPNKKQTAKDLTAAIDDTNKKRQQRQVLELGFRHLPVYFTAVIKAIWNPELGDSGEFEFVNIHPDLIVADHTAKTNNADQMGHVFQKDPVKVQDLFMRFPEKRESIVEELEKMGISPDGDDKFDNLATEVDMYEVWFTWYKKSEEPLEDGQVNSAIMEPGVKWERVEGTAWMLGDTILKKMKNPYFDYEGEQKTMVYDNPADANSGHEVQPEEIMLMAMTGQGMENLSTEMIYHNYFKMPRKPYYFFGYNQWGKIPYDETSRIEQNLSNQGSLDLQERQIDNTLKTRRKFIWSTEGGVDSEAVQGMDMDNPKLDALVGGDLNKVVKVIEPERPDAAQFNNVGTLRDRMFSMAGANAIRGDLQSDVATSNQIAREANFTRTDALVEATINSASEWMAQWQMQMIKLFYTEEHMRQILGAKGSMTYIKLRRDMVEDGMEVVIKSSTTDKLKAQKNAMDMAGLKLIDPFTFYEDMGMTDPQGRVEKLMLFNTDPAGYQAKYALGLENSAQMGAALQQQPIQGDPNTPPGQQMALPMDPQNPIPTDTTAVPQDPGLIPDASPRVL